MDGIVDRCPSSVAAVAGFLHDYSHSVFLDVGRPGQRSAGKVLSPREAEYILAAKSMGASARHIFVRHLFPGRFSHIIVVATLSIPGMILGETSLSFLGLGPAADDQLGSAR